MAQSLGLGQEYRALASGFDRDEVTEIVAGAAPELNERQIGAATASASPLRLPAVDNVQLQLPAGQFLPGLNIPSLTDALEAGPHQWTPASAVRWKVSPKLQAPAPAPEPQAEEKKEEEPAKAAPESKPTAEKADKPDDEDDDGALLIGSL